MRGRTPLADDTPKRAPPAPPREAAPADIAGGRGSRTEVSTLPCFSPPTAPTKMVTSASSADEHLISQPQKNYTKDRQHQSKEVTGVYYRGQTAQDKRSRLTNVINSLYRKVPVNDRSSVERNLETLEKYVMTVLNGVIKDAETEGTESRKTDDSYNGPSKDSIIGGDDKPLSRLSSEPSAVEPAVPSVSVAQHTESPNNETKSEDTEVKKEEPAQIDDKATLDTELQMSKVSQEQIDTADTGSTELIQKTCRELLNDLVGEVSRTADEIPNASLQCSLPLEKVAPVLEICEPTPSNLSKSTVRHLCLYCDRKFLSISLRQRHTERVHQLGGGRRSDRNTRKTNCQYCSEKCAENLEGLFQHMIGSHSDKYHGCLQCSTRYSTKEALVSHTNELHPSERTGADYDASEKSKEVKRETSRTLKMFTPMKLNILPRVSNDVKDNSTSHDFDSTFYSNVSCNIRENLLHHLDGKLHHSGNSMISQSCYQQQTFYEPVTQIQFPIDISLTAATPVYNKDYTTNDEYENSSEYAQKPGKISSSHPRRVSFEKYNFPKKYDGKEQWTYSIKDISEFDISTQLTLRKKQQLLKEKLAQLETKKHDINSEVSTGDVINDSDVNEAGENEPGESTSTGLGTQFSVEFGNFMRLRRWDECPTETVKNEEVVYAELTGEWSRPRVYICGACSSKHQTLKELEDHKVVSHPNVWCSHLEFSGDQTELDKHLVLPGRGVATMKAKNVVIPEKICTKCSKVCLTLSELHKHMLECGGDQTWLLGLFGNGKKKCKWRPFGSRRRRQRGMKRNIQNSQNSQNQVNRTPKEKQPGPRVRPSDRESIEKMLANLPAKRSTRRVMQEINLRSQGRLRKIQTRSKQRVAETPNSRLSQKAVLRNKLVKNAKSFQRKRCRGDNISAAIESVINNYDVNTRKSKIIDSKEDSKNLQSLNRSGKIVKGVRVVSKRRNIKIQETKSTIKTLKGRKNSSAKLVNTEPKITRSNTHNIKLQEVDNLPTVRRRKPLDLVIGVTTVKTKSQLRTNDGKFTRNPIKYDQNSSDVQSIISTSSSSQLSGEQVVRTNSTRFPTRSKQRKKMNIALPRRITRVSSDADKMPTLEPADKLTSRQVDSGKSFNELPILSPVAKIPATVQNSTSPKQTSVKQITGVRRRGRKNTLGRKIENSEKPDNSAEAVEDVKTICTRTRKSVESQKLESAKSSEVSNSTEDKFTDSTKKSNLQLTSFPIKKTKLTKVVNVKRTRQQHRKASLEEPKPESPAEDTKSNCTVKSPEKIKRKSLNQKTKALPKEKIVRRKRKNVSGEQEIDKDCKREISATRKSPRNLEKKSLTALIDPLPPALSSKDADSLVNAEKPNQKQLDDKIKEPICPDAEVEKITEVSKNEIEPTIETVDETKIELPIDKSELELPKIETEKAEIVDKDPSPVEMVNDLVNLSFEHLQQESSNSNIDSGKENSSETPINITKSKVPRPKKSRGFRRDRGQVKRTLNNVIGILTEGVNIPIEVQQSVVLTVQTSIESLNPQSHNSNIQTEVGRVDLADGSVASGTSNTISINPSGAVDSLEVDSAVNNENSVGQIEKIETQVETSGQEATAPPVEMRPAEPENKTTATANSTPASNTIEPFPNDIILDLSRRKQNGKGSFLEKIVSKIAKQKDALLDHDVGSLLDHAVDELSIILDDVGPKAFEADTEADIKEGKTNNSTKENVIKLNDSAIKEENTLKENETKKSNDKVSTSPVKCVEQNESNNTKEENNVASIAPDVDNNVTLPSINQDESKEIERTSKKRSSDTALPVQNKRKSVNDEETEETKIEDELYLTDIMKLINSTAKLTQAPITCDANDEVRVGKRKIIETVEKISSEIENSQDDTDICATSSSKKSRRNQKEETKSPTKSINVNNRGRRCRKSTPVSNSKNIKDDSDDTQLVKNNEALLDRNSIDDENTQLGTTVTLNKSSEVISEITEAEKSEDPSATRDNSKEIPLVETLPEGPKNKEDIVKDIVPEKPIKSKRRGAPKKKSLADEHLDLSDDEIVRDTASKTNEILKTTDSTEPKVNTDQSVEDKSSATVNNSEPIISDVSSNLPESIASEDKSAPTDSTREQKISKRKNNHGKIDTPEVETSNDRQTSTPVQRRQTLKRKAKENIFLIEELLDFGDDIDSPPEISQKEDKIEENKVTEDVVETVTQISQIEESGEVKKCDDEKKITEEPKINAEVINEPNPVNLTNKVDPIEEPQNEDEHQSPKKRASGNFAVVHTKSGEILIVEKKKKFTKEAAKFFCDVCATSFTRKSSLKKHNLSQSHILQVSKCGNEPESLSLTESVPLEISTYQNPFLPEKDSNEKVSDETREEVPQVPLANSKIDTIETTTPSREPEPFNSELEEELLDEEICKITENMTHDEYVLTDHVSPEGEIVSTPDKPVTDVTILPESLKAQHKINLANEHLELESPQPHVKLAEQIVPSATVSHSDNAPTDVCTSPKGKVSLDFSNIAEKLKDKKFMQNEEQKSISVDITEKKEQDESSDVKTDECKKIEDEEMNVEVLSQAKKPSKSSSPRKSKNRRKKSKKKTADSRGSESEEESDMENTKSQNKNKIVKSVFGRAFTSEKLDKVMEVLDDWNSKSDTDSPDEESVNSPQAPPKDEKFEKNRTDRDKTEEKIEKKGKSMKLDESNSLPVEISSRCRQSKKRAEERISRAFEEESIPYELAFDALGKELIPADKLSTNESPENVDKDAKLKVKSKKTEVDYPLEKKKDATSPVDSFTTSKRKIITEDFSLADTNSMESIHTRVPSCPRERSSTPDLISVTTRESDNEVEEFATDINDDDDDEQLSIRGRLSPFYASNAPESSINSGTMSTSNHVNNTDGFMEARRGSSNEFSGEKIVIRSPVLSSQESCPGVVTIAPTDAIEDNALDVPQEIDGIKEKPGIPRQGKVLNFDEELFVECCSRLKATTENELRGAKKIKLDPTDDYQSRDETTQQSSQGVRQIPDRWRDVESQNSLGSLLESVNQLLGEEMYNSGRGGDSHKRRNERRETVSPVRATHSDFIRPDNISYEDSLDVAFEHNNKLRDKIQQRMRESENMIATSFGQKVTNNTRNYRQNYDGQNVKSTLITDKMKNDRENFSYSSKHIPLEPLTVNSKMNSGMDGFLDEALSNLLHRNGKHDHNGSTPMNVLAELACAQVPSTTTSDVKTPIDKVSSKNSSHKIEKELPKKCRNPIKELFERKKELNDRKKESTAVKQRSKKSKHQDEFPLIRKSQFGVGMPERKKRHNYEKKSENPSTTRIKDVYEFDDEDSQTDTKFKTSYRTHTEKLNESVNQVKSKDSEINVVELMSRTITKTLDNGKSTEGSGKRLDSMIERKFQESESFIPKTKGALKSFHMEEKHREKQTTGPMDNFVERKRFQRTRRLTETSGKTSKTKRKGKNSKRRSRNAWYEDDSSDEFVTAVKTEDVGVGITKSQRTCSKGKQNLFAELSSTSSESEYEEIHEEKKDEDKDAKIKEWMDGIKVETKNIDDNEKIESDHPLIIDEKEDEEAPNSGEETDNRSEQAFEDDLYREDSSIASSDDEEEASKNPPKNEPPDEKSFGKSELIPLDEALVLLDNPDNDEKKESIDRADENVEKVNEIAPTVDSFTEDLPEKLSSNEKPNEKQSDNLPLHIFLSRKVQESKKKKEEKLKKLQMEKEKERERERKREQEELQADEECERNKEQFIEFQSTRRQRKCAIGKQGLLAEISSSDEEYYYKDTERRSVDKSDYEKSRRQKRESKEKRKERYMEKKHELIIAKEQKAIEEEILRELKMKKTNETDGQNSTENCEYFNQPSDENKINKKQRSKNFTNDAKIKDDKKLTNSDTENKCNKLDKKIHVERVDSSRKLDNQRDSTSNKKNDKKEQTSPDGGKSVKKSRKSSTKPPSSKQNKSINGERSHSANRRNSKERKSANCKRDTDDEELRTTKSWNRVDEGVGVAIGRRKRAAANQLYYWSSSTDEDEELIQVAPVVEEEDDRQEQHGWIVGDSHKKMITMLAMEKQLKEKRRRSEDEFESGKIKNKKYRNSTS